MLYLYIFTSLFENNDNVQPLLWIGNFFQAGGFQKCENKVLSLPKGCVRRNADSDLEVVFVGSKIGRSCLRIRRLFSFFSAILKPGMCSRKFDADCTKSRIKSLTITSFLGSVADYLQ